MEVAHAGAGEGMVFVGGDVEGGGRVVVGEGFEGVGDVGEGGEGGLGVACEAGVCASAEVDVVDVLPECEVAEILGCCEDATQAPGLELAFVEHEGGERRRLRVGFKLGEIWREGEARDV